MSEWQAAGYAEEAELGRGGGGRVVVAVEQASGQRVAVKYLADRLVNDAGFRAAFRGEAQIMSGLDLPHVVRVRRYVESDDGAAIVMDLVPGVSLRRILTEHGPAGARAALTVLKGSLTGLAGAHRAGIVHRDYKPENVIVDQSGTSMLVDFGIAARTGQPGRPAGTPGYAAPEQWAGGPASPAGDIYAAAVTFAECAGDTEPIGPRLSDLVTRATDADPARRPADAAALLAELQEAADDRYGPTWEEDGRADLARLAAALLALAAGAVGAAAGTAATAGTTATAGTAASAPAQGPAAATATTLTRTRGIGRAGRAGAGAGHAPAIIAGVVVVVIGAGVGIAVAVSGHHHSPGPGTAASSQPGASASGQRSGTPSASPSPAGSTVLAVNPSDPCTWLTQQDFARNGITSGALHSGTEPAGWRICRSSSVRIGLRSPAPNTGCLGLLGCTSASIPGADSGRYLTVAGFGTEIDAFRAGLEYAVGVTRGGASHAALLRLMELVLTRTAAGG